MLDCVEESDGLEWADVGGSPYSNADLTTEKIVSRNKKKSRFESYTDTIGASPSRLPGLRVDMILSTADKVPLDMVRILASESSRDMMDMVHSQRDLESTTFFLAYENASGLSDHKHNTQKQYSGPEKK